VVVTSSFAQQRILRASDYCTSKHALNRLVEFIALGTQSACLTFCYHSVLTIFERISQVESICVAPRCPQDPVGRRRGRWVPRRHNLRRSTAAGDNNALSHFWSPRLVERKVSPRFSWPFPQFTTLLTSIYARYLSANWDIAEIERDWKEKIQIENALVSKLTIPK
jgi:hypothetical protein